MEKYLVFDIQKFSYHDGPGIRTTVFLKGCNLSCFWCQNPESQSVERELMYFYSSCMHCGTCITQCVAGVLYLDDKDHLRVDREKCTLCGSCVKSCPTESLQISGRYMTADEILDTVEEDREMYRLSGGGVTFSGGEPLMHSHIIDLLKEAKRRGIETAIETAGNISSDILKSVIAYTDVFLYDLKVWDDMRHRECCGYTNKRILENLKLLKEYNAKVQVRIPVIPTVNDNEAEIRRMAEYIRNVGFSAPEMLMFNTLGAFKYAALEKEYAAKELPQLEKEIYTKLKNIVDEVFSGPSKKTH